MAKWSNRVSRLTSFKVMDLLKRAKALEAQGFDVVHMAAGEPDFPTAAPIRQAAEQAIAAGLTQYTPAGGIPELRQSIAHWYQSHYGIHITPEQVLVTPGASGALTLLFALLAEEGSQFMMADPGYPCNRQFLNMMGASALEIPTSAGNRFQLTADDVCNHWAAQTAGVLVASPSNPCGATVPPEKLAAIYQETKQRGGSLIVDELYHGLTYDVPAETALKLGDDVFVVNSFSKYFGMTGWRLGWLIGPEDAVAEMERMAQHLFISPPTVSQYAALAAFEPRTIAILDQRRDAFKQRRDLLIEGLKDIGFTLPFVPDGAFYLYADASYFTNDTYEFCWDLLENQHVSTTPGLDFGNADTQKYMRFAYTTDISRIELALSRIRQALA